MAYQYALPRRDTLTGSDQPGPRAFVVHHTGGGSSAKNIVDYWRANRPGIGTQYIMDRDGNVHSVKDEFGYSGTSHVHPGFTPKEFKDKGLVNKNMLGMEIMAKNDKDVTPVQAKAFAEFMQKNYPNMPIYGHGELNPGHREPDEGQTAKAAAMALRNGGAAAATTGAAPGTADPAVQAGAGPAAVAAARTADAAPKPANADENMTKKAFLATLSRGEAPKGAYSMINGGGKMADLSQLPTGTRAAGQYQFLPSTFAEEAKKYGYKDFKEGTQDTAAWNHARDVYSQKTGRHLEQDLASGDPNTLNSISKTLSGTWTSLPGGAEPNSNWAGKDFASVYAENLRGSGTGTAYPDPTPNVGSGSSDYPAPSDTAIASAPADTSVSTYDAANAVSPGSGNKDYSKDVGDMFSSFGDLMAKGPVAQNAAKAPIAANVPMASLPVPQGPVPMVDPRVADAQRQQLAVALQRLNSGRLV